MEIEKKGSGNHIVLTIRGMIDTTTSQDLSDEISKLDFSDLDLTLDFTDTDYITSAGLRVLWVAQKKSADNSMHIVGVNESIAEVFETTGFSELLDFTVAYDKESEENGEEDYKSFKALLKDAVQKEPQKLAYVFKDKEYTLSDIDKASQIIAEDLSRLGVKKGSHVGICSMNSINWVFTFFAIQKLGAVAVLVNYGLKPSEIVSLSEIGDITHLCLAEIEGVTDFDVYKSALKGSKIEMVYDISEKVDFTKRFGEYESICNDFPEMYHADDASVIIFTSGSTGKPKAVLLSAFNLITSITPLVKEFDMTEKDRNCAFLPFFHVFGFSTGIVIGALVGTVSYIPDKPKPDVLLNLIEKYRCTLFHSVPTMMLAMTKCDGFTPERVSSIRVSALGGAAITTAQMCYLMQLFPNNRFSNVYGMSENAAISITGYGDTPEHITGTVGKPLSHVEVVIRDPVTKEVKPQGESGEICIRSATMIICYYKMSLKDQPLDGEGWLSTGDLGVIEDDGYLKLVGRVKDLIIRNGENISPREVADAITSAPEIADVKVVGMPDADCGEQVVAAIILEKGKTFDEEKMRKFLSDKLAKFKIPSHFFVFESFPLLGSGKTDDMTIKRIIAEKLK